MAKDKYEKKETSVRLKMKGGAVVDPDSQLEDVAHVMKVYILLNITNYLFS